MKKTVLGIIVGLLTGGVGAWFFLHEAEHEKEGKKEEKKESRVQHGTNGETFLKLDEAAQKHLGLKVVSLEAAELKPEVAAFGRVVDPASLAASLTEIASAQAALEASGREAARLKTLFEQGQNASARALETAEATVKRDRIAAEAAQLRLLSSWGSAIAGRSNLDLFIRSLVAQETALVRVDVPAGEKLAGSPTAVRLASLAASDAPFEAEFVGSANATDPQTLGQGFFCLVKGRSLPVNAVVNAWLSLPGDTEKGVIIPRDAIVRHEGEGFVYVQTGADAFERKELELHHPLAAGWFTDEFKAGVKVVITGAQQLLSEELKGEGGEE